MEHYLLHRLRGDPAYLPGLDWVALVAGRPVGVIACPQALVTGADGVRRPVATFGPIGVLPDWRGQRVGSALIETTLPLAAERGYGGLVITGDPDCCRRFGFRTGKAFGIRPGDGCYHAALLARSCAPASCRGSPAATARRRCSPSPPAMRACWPSRGAFPPKSGWRAPPPGGGLPAPPPASPRRLTGKVPRSHCGAGHFL
ncbi:GNAT family N-acetyltransferase [Bittarella massiliensis (ex Durand et al. 2017)]|uniref:GNAT family N-acetyltransferase n=1 Tax=Bittarella massiliensis (ex Durand et al. 2017) TaxID=1720313 RepID=UPI0012B643AC|nr:GNAT family N-acetyltransferase [Bittarella massiliensis (ex Durand et al. 2017)]